MKTGKHQFGFTLVELMVTLVVVAIVLTIAGPSFRDFIANNRLTTMTNNLVTAISFARSEAVRRANTVRIVAVAPSGGNEWGEGWQVVDNGGNVIRVFQGESSSVTMDDTGGVTALTFDSRGFLSNLPGGTSIAICDNRDGEVGRQLTISATGRPQLNRQFNGC